jgi:hypothetical protein
MIYRLILRTVKNIKNNMANNLSRNIESFYFKFRLIRIDVEMLRNVRSDSLRKKEDSFQTKRLIKDSIQLGTNKKNNKK